MPDMTKEDPEPTGDTKTQRDGKPCTECGVHHHGTRHAAKPGSRRWFWGKRVDNMLLSVGAMIPLGYGTGALLRPDITTPLTDKQKVAINGVYEYAGAKPSTVYEVVTRFDHPSIGDRLVAAGPCLGFAALLGFLIYALWRIEINMSAGGRPYTEKDARVFARARRWVWSGWWLIFGLETLGGIWYHYGPSGGWFRAGAHVPLDGLSVVILGVSGLLAVVARMYTTGARAYAELEKGV
jgi:hypothetical protein